MNAILQGIRGGPKHPNRNVFGNRLDDMSDENRSALQSLIESLISQYTTFNTEHPGIFPEDRDPFMLQKLLERMKRYQQSGQQGDQTVAAPTDPTLPQY